MNLYIGSQAIVKAYMGSNPISKIYQGNTPLLKFPANTLISLTNKVYSDISIQVVSSNESPEAGGSFIYSWTITNNRADAASNIKVLANYPTNINITRARALNTYTTTTLTTNLNDNIIWVIPALEPGFSEIAIFNAQAISSSNSFNSPNEVFHSDIWNATLTVDTDASSYQWQISNDSGVSWSNISGATNQALSLIDLTASDNGKQYRAITTDNGITTINKTITLSLS